MRLRLAHKLLLALIAGHTIVLAMLVYFLSMQWQVGFQRYLQDSEEQRLQPLVEALENYYLQYGQWENIYYRPRIWAQYVSQYLNESIPGPNGRYRPSSDFGPGSRPSSRPGPGNFPGPAPGRAASNPIITADGNPMLAQRLQLLDANRSHIIGNDNLLPKEADYFVPIYNARDIVGWLKVSALNLALNQAEKDFSERQLKNILYTGILAIAVAALLAFLITQYLMQPIRSLKKTSRKLISGDYSIRSPIHSHDELGLLAQDINHLAQTLEDNEQARRQWIADISHELRTPIAVMRGEIEAMQDGIRPLNEQSLHSLHQENTRLQQLVEDLYQLALSDLGALSYRKQTIDLRDVVEDVANNFALSMEKQGLECDVCLPNKACLVLADENRLVQCLVNLAQNSLRYTDAPGLVHISLKLQAERYQLIWQDSSPGVATEQRDKLFERFYRVEKSRNRAKGGAGLGMALCQNIVHAHHGQIQAQASELGGLAIIIDLPIEHESD